MNFNKTVFLAARTTLNRRTLLFLTTQKLSNSLTTLTHLPPKLDIYSLAHHLCKMLVFYEPRRVTLGNT